ncbi:hypothetical protein GCM10022255_110100 [Dactylosporangium darangshiense]|uniref:Uncharacterized protein n=1 Tax=Dactylosporangium darangshiense TaxID=579108 RepID=A0ABP8DVE9_9ACTN
MIGKGRPAALCCAFSADSVQVASPWERARANGCPDMIKILQRTMDFLCDVSLISAYVGPKP